jgi:hypothetical protein
MKTISLNFYRDPKQPEDIDVLKKLAKEHIIDKPEGHVTFNWSMQQCGLSVWYDLRGYIGSGEDLTAVSIRYTWL